MRLDLKPGESARIRYVLRCPLRGHYTIGPVSLRHRNTFNLGVDEMRVDHHSDVIVFPQVKDVEEAFLRSRTPKMYTGATTLRTPGQGSEFYSLREYVPGDPFKSINWKAYARTGDLMVNEKCRDAVTDVFILLDAREIARIGTVLKNPLEVGVRLGRFLGQLLSATARFCGPCHLRRRALLPASRHRRQAVFQDPKQPCWRGSPWRNAAASRDELNLWPLQPGFSCVHHLQRRRRRHRPCGRA